MKLTDFISKKAIVPILKSTDKRGAVTELVQAMKKAYDAERFAVPGIVDAILDREKLGSTGLGGGVAVPHAKLDGVKGVIGAFGRCSTGLHFGAVDGESVHLVFLILAPPSKNEAYLLGLKTIMSSIRRPNFARFLRGAKNVREIDEIFREVEEVASV